MASPILNSVASGTPYLAVKALALGSPSFSSPAVTTPANGGSITQSITRSTVVPLSLTLGAGERWFVLGPNGAGKSTLLKTLAGLLPQAQNTVFLQGLPITHYSAQALAQIRVWNPQQTRDSFALKVLDWILAAIDLQTGAWHWDDAQALAAAQHWLAVFNLTHLAQRNVLTLSGGERQRLTMAASVGRKTAIYLLDEPTAQIDIGQRFALLRTALRACIHPAPLWVIATHDLDLAALFATHVLLIAADQTWLAGPAEALLNASALSRTFGCELRCHHQEGRLHIWTP